MNSGMQPGGEFDPSTYADFPEVQGEGKAADQPSQDKGSRKGYQNEIFSNDSLTTCDGFMNEVKSHTKGEETMYFARVGLLMGSKKNDQGEWVGDIVNCDLLVGSTLRKWAEYTAPIDKPFRGVRMKFKIRNLKFSPGIHEGKPVLNSRGVLETVTFGHLD